MAAAGALVVAAVARHAGPRAAPTPSAHAASAAADASSARHAVAPMPDPGLASPPASSLASVAPEPLAAAARAARPRLAHLTVNADPWAYVTIDGKRRGTTPLVDLVLSAGAHEITFDNPELGASRARVIKLAPAEHRTVIERLTP